MFKVVPADKSLVGTLSGFLQEIMQVMIALIVSVIKLIFFIDLGY
jgi:hypothetical protein